MRRIAISTVPSAAGAGCGTSGSFFFLRKRYLFAHDIQPVFEGIHDYKSKSFLAMSHSRGVEQCSTSKPLILPGRQRVRAIVSLCVLLNAEESRRRRTT
jgi:hypothetical protein